MRELGVTKSRNKLESRRVQRQREKEIQEELKVSAKLYEMICEMRTS
jgi:hypothetical protein